MTAKNKPAYSSEEIDVDVSVVLGTATLRVNQLLKLGRGAVVELDRNIDDVVDIHVNDVLVGHGEVVITENDNHIAFKNEVTFDWSLPCW
jgi:flagellar motor switch protein FliN/FliY